MACEVVKLANGQLVAVPLDGKKVKHYSVEFGYYLLIKDWTGRELSKQRLRGFWKDWWKSQMTKLFGGAFIITKAYSYVRH